MKNSRKTEIYNLKKVLPFCVEVLSPNQNKGWVRANLNTRKGKTEIKIRRSKDVTLEDAEAVIKRQNISLPPGWTIRYIEPGPQRTPLQKDVKANKKWEHKLDASNYDTRTALIEIFYKSLKMNRNAIVLEDYNKDNKDINGNSDLIVKLPDGIYGISFPEGIPSGHPSYNRYISQQAAKSLLSHLPASTKVLFTGHYDASDRIKHMRFLMSDDFNHVLYSGPKSGRVLQDDIRFLNSLP